MGLTAAIPARMTTPKAKFAGLSLIAALCGGFISMSAFGGKADVNHCVGECPLIAISGHKGGDEKS